MSVSPTKVLAEATDTNDKSSETVLDDLVGYNLKRAYMIVQADFRDTLGEDGLTARVFSALSLVVENPNITQSELAWTLRIERSGLVAIVDQLEERKLLTRNSVVGDRRVYALAPTALGIRTFKASLKAVQQHEERLFSSLSRTEQAELLMLLKKFRGASEKDIR